MLEQCFPFLTDKVALIENRIAFSALVKVGRLLVGFVPQGLNLAAQESKGKGPGPVSAL